VDYARFDRRSRAEWNAGILDGNIRSTYARIDRLERQAARLRQRHMQAQRRLSIPELSPALRAPWP
jgi:hypothetical protein